MSYARFLSTNTYNANKKDDNFEKKRLENRKKLHALRNKYKKPNINTTINAIKSIQLAQSEQAIKERDISHPSIDDVITTNLTKNQIIKNQLSPHPQEENLKNYSESESSANNNNDPYTVFYEFLDTYLSKRKAIPSCHTFGAFVQYSSQIWRENGHLFFDEFAPINNYYFPPTNTVKMYAKYFLSNFWKIDGVLNAINSAQFKKVTALNQNDAFPSCISFIHCTINEMEKEIILSPIRNSLNPVNKPKRKLY